MPVNSRPQTRTTVFVAALAAMLAAGLFFGTPQPLRTTSPSVVPAAPAPAGPLSTVPAAATVETAAKDDESTNLLPELLRRIVGNVRAKGESIWWADAIEMAFTHGFTAAVDHLRQFVPAEQLDEKTSNLLSLVGQERLEFLGEGLPLIHDTNHRSSAASSIIYAWTRKDALKLASYATEHLSGDHKNRALERAIEALGKSARFSDAQTVLNQMPASKVRTQTIESLAQRWGSLDIDGGFAWARQLASAGDRLNAERALIGASRQGAWVERLQELATLYATEETRMTWDSAIGEKLVAIDVVTAAGWAETLQPASRDLMRHRIAAKVAQTDLAQGTALALRIEGDSARTSAIDQIHRELWEKDMQATTAWMWTLPDEFQHRVVVGVVMKWYRADEPGATAWVESLPASRVRDRAMMWLAWEVNRAHPASATEMANKIADPALRKTAFDELRRHAR